MWTAQGDAWEEHGRLREARGGAALALRGIRLMASGLPQPQWNGADVTGPDADLDGARAFYAERGLPWGVRVPAGMPWQHGRRVRSQRLMGLEPAALRPAEPPAEVALRPAGPADLEAVVAVDATAFEADPAHERAWLEPLLGAPRVEVVLAERDGEPVGTAYAVRSDGRAGPCLYLAGVAVAPGARRRGVGAAVSSWLLERGFERGAELAHLHPDTQEAARLYARLGFVETPGFEIYGDL